jgi:LysR family positive regulator for ilvC
VQALEAELGQTLLSRDRREVRLSPAGEVFRRYARAQLEQWEELRASLRAGDETPTGELNVACTVTACHTVLPTLLARFRERYPGVTLRLLTQDAARSRAQLEAGDLDLAVIPTDADAAGGLEVKVLATTEFAFIAPRDLALLGDASLTGPLSRRSLRAAELSRLPLVAPIGGLERERLDAWLERRRVVPRIVAEVRGNEGIIAMVSLGSGIGIVPELVLRSSPLRDAVQTLDALKPPRGYQVSLCARPRALGRRVVEAFWSLAQEMVPQA